MGELPVIGQRRDDHKLPDRAKLSILWEFIFGITRGPEILKAGLVHEIYGWEQVMPDKDGNKSVVKVAHPGIKSKQANMDFEFERIKDHLVALTRLLCEKCQVSTREFTEAFVDHHLNQSFLNTLGTELVEIDRMEAEKRKELEEQLKNKNADGDQEEVGGSTQPQSESVEVEV